MKLKDIDWTAPATELSDTLIELWFERHPARIYGDHEAFVEAETWAGDMIHKYAQ